MHTNSTPAVASGKPSKPYPTPELGGYQLMIAADIPNIVWAKPSDYRKAT